jgi:hypothetical protein
LLLLLATLIAGLDRDFRVPFLALVRHIVPDDSAMFRAVFARLLVRPALRGLRLFSVSHDDTPIGFTLCRSSASGLTAAQYGNLRLHRSVPRERNGGSLPSDVRPHRSHERSPEPWHFARG